MTILQLDIPRLVRRCTRSAFFARFTDDELEDLDFLSFDDPAAATAVRRQKARLRRILRTIESMEHIDLDNARIRLWVLLMEQRGLLQAGRAVAILDSEVQESERP